MATDVAIDRSSLKPVEEALGGRFSRVQEKRGFQADFRVEQGRLAVPTARDLGFQALRLSTEDGSRIAQFRADGFTLNNVGAYVGGDVLLSEALELWAQFAERAQPKMVTRVALRYLNRLHLPLREGEEFRRFLVAPPELPAGAPQRVSAFLSRVVAHDESEATAVITQKLGESREPGSVPPVVIDIDVWVTGDLGPRAEALRPILENLRQVKNRTFFSLITEESVKLYL